MTIYAKTTSDGPAFAPSQLLLASFEAENMSVFESAERSNLTKLDFILTPDTNDVGVSGVNVPSSFGFTRCPDFDGPFFNFSKRLNWQINYGNGGNFEFWPNQYTGYNFSIGGSGTWSWEAEYFKIDPSDPYQGLIPNGNESGTFTMVFDGVTEGDGPHIQVGSIPPDTEQINFSFKCTGFQYDVPISQIFQ